MSNNLADVYLFIAMEKILQWFLGGTTPPKLLTATNCRTGYFIIKK
jgi:hypothetical protein